MFFAAAAGAKTTMGILGLSSVAAGAKVAWAPTIMANLAAAATGLTAYGQYRAGQAAEAQAKSQQAWYNYNAEVARREAESEEAASRFEAQRLRRQGEKLLGRQRAAYAERGLMLEGTPLEVMGETASDIELDAMLLTYGGTRRAGRLRSQAGLDVMAGQTARMRGAAAYRQGVFGAGTSLLTGAINVYAINRMAR